MSPPMFDHGTARAPRGLNDRVGRLVRSNIVPVVVTDGAGRCVVANAPFLDLIGYVPGARAPHALRWDQFALPAERTLDERAASDARKHGAAPPYERTLVCPDGH